MNLISRNLFAAAVGLALVAVCCYGFIYVDGPENNDSVALTAFLLCLAGFGMGGSAVFTMDDEET